MTVWKGKLKQLTVGTIFSYEGVVKHYNYGKVVTRKEQNTTYLKIHPLGIGMGEYRNEFNSKTGNDLGPVYIDPESEVTVLFVEEPVLCQ